MRKLLKILTLSTVMGVILFSCTKEEPIIDWKYVHNQEDLIVNSKAFFENLIITADQNGTLDLESSLAPGEITPKWDNAVALQDRENNYVYVPFEADYYYNVRETVTQKSGEVVYRTFPVQQVLIITQNYTTGDMSASYLTLTPTRAYHMKHRSNVLDNFLSGSTHQDYSGLAFYYDAVTMELLSAEKYRDGELSEEISIVTKTYGEFFDTFYGYVKNYTYLRYENIATRQDGEANSGSSGSDSDPGGSSGGGGNYNGSEQIGGGGSTGGTENSGGGNTRSGNTGSGNTGTDNGNNNQGSENQGESNVRNTMVTDADLIGIDDNDPRYNDINKVIGNFRKFLAAQGIEGNATVNNFQDYLNKVAADFVKNELKEHAAALYDINGEYQIGEIFEGQPDQVSMTYKTLYAIATIHNHPENLSPAPSLQDIVNASQSAYKSSNFQAMYVLAYKKNEDKSFFIVDINNSSKAKTFYTKYGILFSDGVFKTTDNATGEQIQNASKAQSLYNKLLQQYSAYSTTDKLVRTIAAFLEELDAGMEIYEYYPYDTGTPIYNHGIKNNKFVIFHKSW
ncbi:MAG: hypothetical protein LIO79_04105 [Rikenellaceae bacterium]|nr:hypothetical protein [Rikenellaceae bacterium]